jgi:hypothetical protein
MSRGGEHPCMLGTHVRVLDVRRVHLKSTRVHGKVLRRHGSCRGDRRRLLCTQQRNQLSVLHACGGRAGALLPRIAHRTSFCEPEFRAQQLRAEMPSKKSEHNHLGSNTACSAWRDPSDEKRRHTPVGGNAFQANTQCSHKRTRVLRAEQPPAGLVAHEYALNVSKAAGAAWPALSIHRRAVSLPAWRSPPTHSRCLTTERH